MTYYEYAINYRLSCLLTISTCILFWNPAGWNVNYVLLELGRRFPPGVLRGFLKSMEKIFGSMRRCRYQDSQAFESCFFDQQTFLTSRMPSNRQEFVVAVVPNWQRSTTRIMEAVCEFETQCYLRYVGQGVVSEKDMSSIEVGYAGITWLWKTACYPVCLLPLSEAFVVITITWTFIPAETKLTVCALGDPKIVPSREVPKRFGEMPWFAIGRKRNAIRSVCVLDGGWLL